MKTELLHSYSSVSLSGLSRSVSQITLANGNQGIQNGGIISGKYTSETGLVKDNGDGSGLDLIKDWAHSTFRRKILYKKVPFLGWIGQYSVNKAVGDFIAGIVITLTLLPQGLAYAQLSGVPGQYGLYSAFVGCFVYIFFGSTAAVNIGPTASMSIITLSYSAGAPPAYVVILTFLTGLVTLSMGLLQLGFIVNFISTPVMSGFTSAVAITIISTQIKSLLGLNFKANGILEVIDGLVTTGSDIRVHDTILSLICMVSLITLQYLPRILVCVKGWSKVLDKSIWLLATARNAIVVIACTLVYGFWGDPSPVGVVGHIVSGLPPFKVPEFQFTGNQTDGTEVHYTFGGIIRECSSALIVIPILAILEHITIAKAVAVGNSRVDASQEMTCIGLSNLIGAFFSSIPITGSFSRTMVNHSSGVQTPMGGLVTGVLVILALQFLTPYFYFIPKAALASVIVCAVMFTIDVGILRPMWRSKRMDIIPWAATFLVSLFLGLELGILCGFLISLFFLLYYAARPRVSVSRGETSTGIEFILIDLDRSLTFPSMEYTNYVVLKSGSNWAKDRLPIVMNCQHIQFADYTAAQGMREIVETFRSKNQELILWRIKPSILRIINGAMEYEKTPFKYCSTEAELEEILEGRRSDLEKDATGIRITFTIMEDEDDDEDVGSGISVESSHENNNNNFNNSGNNNGYQVQMHM